MSARKAVAAVALSLVLAGCGSSIDEPAGEPDRPPYTVMVVSVAGRDLTCVWIYKSASCDWQGWHNK